MRHFDGVLFFLAGFNQYSTDSLKLTCLSKFYHISVGDSLYSNLTWKFHLNSKNQHRGIIIYLDIGRLSRGMHKVDIDIDNWFQKKSGNTFL